MDFARRDPLFHVTDYAWVQWMGIQKSALFVTWTLQGGMGYAHQKKARKCGIRDVGWWQGVQGVSGEHTICLQSVEVIGACCDDWQ